MSGSQVGIEELGQLFSKSLYFPVRGTLLEVSDLQLCSAACCTVWTVPKGEREEAGWEWASIYYQDTHMSTGKIWGSPEFILVSTTSSILGEKRSGLLLKISRNKEFLIAAVMFLQQFIYPTASCNTSTWRYALCLSD